MIKTITKNIKPKKDLASDAVHLLEDLEHDVFD